MTADVLAKRQLVEWQSSVPTSATRHPKRDQCSFYVDTMSGYYWLWQALEEEFQYVGLERMDRDHMWPNHVSEPYWVVLGKI
jgi:hypothetical protein